MAKVFPSVKLFTLRAKEERNKHKTSSRKPSLSKTNSKEAVKTCKSIFDNKTKLLKLFCVGVDCMKTVRHICFPDLV